MLVRYLGYAAILAVGLMVGCASHTRVGVPAEAAASVQRAGDIAPLTAVKAVLRVVRAEQELSTLYLLWHGDDPPSWLLAEFKHEPYSLRKASRQAREKYWRGGYLYYRGEMVEVREPRTVSPLRIEITVALGDPGAREGSGWRVERVWVGWIE